MQRVKARQVRKPKRFSLRLSVIREATSGVQAGNIKPGRSIIHNMTGEDENLEDVDISQNMTWTL